MKNLKFVMSILTIAVFSVNAMAQDMNNKDKPAMNDEKVMHSAVCVLIPAQGNKVTGIVKFTEVSGGVKIVADLKGLTKGKHGFHIHVLGDCTAPDFSSAGDHFNPKSMSHGSPMDAMRHEGDMGNIEADESGNAHLEYVDKTMSFKDDASIIGRSVVVHQNEDDLKTQPSGNAGPRIACGVIGIAK